ncbi:hypothetical protein OE749_13425 [Aestuariibacter sp. AA17]|uniref:Cardiolipin synthase N-terminal domain-containing protein n=1 Tax=Fluctibacter corallii TaxID=2984329 RepID=A0ABT3AAK9_9ALTE|nr:hypothetical protein [Aestuariibacter sp. AA17]MCV2885693.1 hypothetical protein [Aestuariibacter sp. AA17]
MNLNWTLLVVMVFLNLLVSVMLFKRDDLDRFQKVAQTMIVWLFPMFGPLGIWLLHRGQDAEDGKRASQAFGGGSGGNSINYSSGGD